MPSMQPCIQNLVLNKGKDVGFSVSVSCQWNEKILRGFEPRRIPSLNPVEVLEFEKKLDVVDRGVIP